MVGGGSGRGRGDGPGQPIAAMLRGGSAKMEAS